jgi:hypothetical protein
MLVCDGVAQRNCSAILLDVSVVDGRLSVFQRYELGKTVADYCVAHGSAIGGRVLQRSTEGPEVAVRLRP